MLSQLLPQRLDNAYHGYRPALWCLGLVVFMRSAMSLNSIFNGYSVASTADGIPLGTYPAAAAGTVVALFALLGLSRLVICVLCVLVLVRYRSMVPLMFALLLLEQLGKKVSLQFLPILRTGSPPESAINLILLALLLMGLALSLRRQDNAGTGRTVPNR